jgi:hypothetical protein
VDFSQVAEPWSLANRVSCLAALVFAEIKQDLFGRMAKRGLQHGVDRDKDWIVTNDGKLKFQILDVVDYSNGQVMYCQQLPMRLNKTGIAVHNTFQFGGSPGKRSRFREFRFWLADPPEYYDVPVLTYTFMPAKKLIDASPDSVKDHFALMNPQLVALRQAWGLARALGRRLVLPRFIAGLDRAWFPSFHGKGSGQFPGSDPLFTLPFNPPSDHILDYEMMERLGILDEVREFSFLQNAKLPASHSYDVVHVDWTDSAVPGAAKRGAQSADIVESLAQLNSAKVMHFTSMPPGAFGGFSSKADNDRFLDHMRQVGGIWCCEQPGHVWYDFLWDVGPHVDRHGRQRDEWKVRSHDLLRDRSLPAPAPDTRARAADHARRPRLSARTPMHAQQRAADAVLVQHVYARHSMLNIVEITGKRAVACYGPRYPCDCTAPTTAGRESNSASLAPLFLSASSALPQSGVNEQV